MKYREELQKTPQILGLVAGTQPDAALTEAPRLVLCGCGTSFYIAGQVARLCREQGKDATAVEAVEIIDSSVTIGGAEDVFVFISRSGTSLETVMAARRVKQEGRPTLYVGCTEGSPLDRECDRSRVIGFARETLPLESFSYTAQILCLALSAGLHVAADGVPAAVTRALGLARDVFGTYFSEKDFSRIIFLGAPFYMPLIKEMCLKSGEITQKCSEAWGVLEFRHGPRSWADESCLIAVLPGVKTRSYDRRVAEEIVGYGSSVMWYDRKPLHAAMSFEWPEPKYSVEEILTLSAFFTSLAVEIGESCGVDASNLRNLDYAVREL